MQEYYFLYYNQYAANLGVYYWQKGDPQPQAANLMIT